MPAPVKGIRDTTKQNLAPAVKRQRTDRPTNKAADILAKRLTGLQQYKLLLVKNDPQRLDTFVKNYFAKPPTAEANCCLTELAQSAKLYTLLTEGDVSKIKEHIRNQTLPDSFFYSTKNGEIIPFENMVDFFSECTTQLNHFDPDPIPSLTPS